MKSIFLSIALLAMTSLFGAGNNWQPVGDGMMTRWAGEINPECPLPEYPRPQMVRQQWQNLNGLWNYHITTRENSEEILDKGKILVPFAIESALSGVKRTFLPKEMLWYERTFDIPEEWNGKRVILHFGAVDYISTVKVNGNVAGTHTGSSDAFSFDITDLLTGNKNQKVEVTVVDPTDKAPNPRGKQVLKPQGIYYTAVSGIWKTVWLEPVENTYIKSYVGVPDIDRGEFRVRPTIVNANTNTKVRYSVMAKGKRVLSVEVAHNSEAVMKIDKAKLWSPDSPFLYDLKMEVINNGLVSDAVDSYFGMRKISVAQDKDGINRIMLNNKFLFQYGFLDQGWWPDGLLTAPTEEALLYDIIYTKQAGYNTIRKHIKIESDRFYYHCDRLGLIVWQDAISGDSFNLKNKPKNVTKSPIGIKRFETELKAMMDQLINYPSIVNWVIFNEGWGQYGERTVIDWAREYDPSRLVEVSGWVDMGNGHVCDIHRYPAPNRIEEAGADRAFAVGEFGGLGLPIEGHLWNPNMRNWGYATYTTNKEFSDAYKHLVFHLNSMIAEGLSAAIYTQTTDVEGEVNGMLTYDREIAKISAEELNEIHAVLYKKSKGLMTIMEDSSVEGQMWSYTTNKPTGEWYDANYNYGSWQRAKGTFGYNHPNWQLGYSYDEREAVGHLPRTEWRTPEIWMSREFTLTKLPKQPMLRLRFDEHAEVYINGMKVASVNNRIAHYHHSDLILISDEGKKAMVKGKNTIAVYSKREIKKGAPANQMIDVEILDACGTYNLK